VDGPHWNLRGNGGILSTARDMFRWHRALSDDTVLSAPAREKFFTPSMPVPDSDESYAYGWAILDTGEGAGRIAWHDGGNSRSIAGYARSLQHDTIAFWVSNQAYQDGGWNLEELEPDLTLGILSCAGTDPA
jgi:CubicO group peptidase (beta-lactamase class C family)